MNSQEKIETPYVLNEGVIISRSLEPYNAIFSSPEPNTGNYASHVEVVPQQPHRFGYHSSLLEFPDPTSQLMQSMINQDLRYHTTSGKSLQPNLDSFGKSQSNSGIPPFTNFHAQSGNKGRALQSRTTAEFSCSNHDMEKVLNSSWRELAGEEHRGNYRPSNSWMGCPGVQNIVPSGGAAIGKQRIRWTHELHEQFVEAVNSLGGAMKATPKGILRLMASQGLTIFHIKSHLQKYRTAKCTPNFLEEFCQFPSGSPSVGFSYDPSSDCSLVPKLGRSLINGLVLSFFTTTMSIVAIDVRFKHGHPLDITGKNGRTNHDEMPMSNLKGNGGFHLSEALRMQMDVQKSLHEHLEFQKKLQMRIEQHANYLQKMFEQQTTSRSFFESHDSDRAIDPSITECSSTRGFGDHEMFIAKLDP